MANEITLPRLGWDMTEGALDSWRKKDGEFVQQGEILFEMEGVTEEMAREALRLAQQKLSVASEFISRTPPEE